MRARAWLGFVLCYGIALHAGAQDRNDDRDALYAEGRELSDAERWDEAADKFRKVIEIRASPKALIALAFVERNRRHLLLARELCREAVSLAEKSSDPADHDLALAALKDAENGIPRIHVQLPAGVTRFELEVDVKRANLSGSRVEVDPGHHTIKFTTPGRAPVHKSVEIEAGEINVE